MNGTSCLAGFLSLGVEVPMVGEGRRTHPSRSHDLGLLASRAMTECAGKARAKVGQEADEVVALLKRRGRGNAGCEPAPRHARAFLAERAGPEARGAVLVLSAVHPILEMIDPLS